MNTELTMLALSVGLLLILILIQAAVGIRSQGLVVMAGSRDKLQPITPFHARATRIVDNHREGLTLFAPLVLIAAVAGISTSWTVLGAQLFFYARVAHAIVYLLGIPLLRPLPWVIGLIGTAMFLLTLLGLL